MMLWSYCSNFQQQSAPKLGSSKWENFSSLQHLHTTEHTKDKMWFGWCWFYGIVLNTQFNIKDKSVFLFLNGKKSYLKILFWTWSFHNPHENWLKTLTVQSSYIDCNSLRHICVFFLNSGKAGSKNYISIMWNKVLHRSFSAYIHLIGPYD